ncbi:MAG: SMP-30/gluconolactonase/LRE family protein [Thermoguttaceae bacterium]|nr:SMP-30/gluconolactonase/LRE family protein [Thermoguttaceae bacterium]
MRTTILRFCSALWMGLLWAAFVGLQPSFAQELPASHSVLPEFFVDGFSFAEGPAFDADGNLYVVNYNGPGKIGKITPAGEAEVFCDLQELAPVEGRLSKANGLKVDREGRILAADDSAARLLRIAKDGKSCEILADTFEGKPFHGLNDVALDLAGNIFFTDPTGSNAEKLVGGVYRYDIQTGNVTQIGTGLAFPNGVAVSPDQTKLVVSESQLYRLLVYDLAADGTVSNRRVLIQFPLETRVVDGVEWVGGKHDPDGLVFDTQGRIYVGMWTAGVVNVVDLATGKWLRQYDAGGSQSTNCAFRDGYLYVTVAAKKAVFRTKLGVTGFDYNGKSPR